MASGETAPPSKVPPKPSGAQEQIPATSSSAATAAASSAVVYPDWSGFQAYSPVPPHGFFPPVVSSPQTHPYMWGTQSMMPPYGTPPPPFVMYPHGGVYVHPSVSAGTHPFSPYAMPSPGGNPESFNAAPETDGKASEGKEGSSMKRPNGSLGKGTKEMGKPSGASANGAVSQSETGSEGSSGGSDADSQNDSLGKAADAGGSRNGGGKTTRGPQNGSAHPPSHGTLTQPLAIMPVMPAGASGPTTNLNIGMDYWGGPTIAPIRSKDHNAPGQSIPPELRLQDERELKRERRKQSNRESARRSRLRKQAECEDLTQRVESLQQENTSLTAEVSRVRKEYEELLSENNSLKERLEQISKGTEDSQQCRKEEGREGPLDSTAGACV